MKSLRKQFYILTTNSFVDVDEIRVVIEENDHWFIDLHSGQRIEISYEDFCRLNSALKILEKNE